MDVQAAINAGLFVEFVYSHFTTAAPIVDLNGKTVVNDYGEDVIPGKTYTVLKTIYCNDLATEVRPFCKDFVTIGIVAQNAADNNDIYVAVRGTEGVWEWLQDFKFLPKPFNNVPGGCFAEDGFTDMYQSFSFAASPSTTFMADLKKLIPANASVTVSGHSLGSALATLLAFDMAVNTSTKVGLYTLASPRVGDLTFERLFNHVVNNAYRVTNRLDIVPKTPPPLLYFHVGDETELIPSPAMKFDLGCEHHIGTYFNLLANLINPNQTQYLIQPSCLKNPPAATATPQATVQV
jgi:triacylglycerol lipase